MALNRSSQAHRLALLVYLLYALGILFGITAVIGVIVNHTLIHQTQGTNAYSHFIWQIVSFWILFAGVATTIALWPYSTLVALACLMWWFATGAAGLYFLLNRKPMPLGYFASNTLRH